MSESNKLLQRIIRQSGVSQLLDILSKRLSPSDLQSLLLEVFQRKARKITPAQLLSNYTKDKSVQPLPEGPYYPHFKIFCHSIGGKDEGNCRFEVESLLELLGIYLNFLETFQEIAKQAYRIKCLVTKLQDNSKTELLKTQVLEVLEQRFPNVDISLYPERQKG